MLPTLHGWLAHGATKQQLLRSLQAQIAEVNLRHHSGAGTPMEIDEPAARQPVQPGAGMAAIHALQDIQHGLQPAPLQTQVACWKYAKGKAYAVPSLYLAVVLG